MMFLLAFTYSVSKGFCFAMTTYYSHIASIHSVFRCFLYSATYFASIY